MLKYIFTCAESHRDCKECNKKAFAFITSDIELAEKHSRENNARMWISKE